jgi:hypothetical protein
MNEPTESTWRIRSGCGLVLHAPLSDELRTAHQKEDQREREQAERDAELRAQQAAERLGELKMKGVQPRSRSELFAQISTAMDRQDRRDAASDERYREKYGTPRPGQTAAMLQAAKEERQAREAVEAATPASFAKVKALEGQLDGQLTSLKRWLHAVTGERPV